MQDNHTVALNYASRRGTRDQNLSPETLGPVRPADRTGRSAGQSGRTSRTGRSAGRSGQAHRPAALLSSSKDALAKMQPYACHAFQLGLCKWYASMMQACGKLVASTLFIMASIYLGKYFDWISRQAIRPSSFIIILKGSEVMNLPWIWEP